MIRGRYGAGGTKTDTIGIPEPLKKLTMYEDVMHTVGEAGASEVEQVVGTGCLIRAQRGEWVSLASGGGVDDEDSQTDSET